MKFVPKRLEETADISRGDTTWLSFLKNALSVVIVLGLGYLALGLLAGLLARLIPDSWEAGMFPRPGTQAFESAELERAQAIFDRLIEREGLRALPYRLFVLPDDDPNAFAFPGGTVGVTQGLLDTVESETGLAAVLGHELGHHQDRHPLKRLGRVLVFRVASSLVFGGGSNSVVDASLKIAESSYSRSQELEADAFGLRLVHEVYGHVEGSLEFFEEVRLEEEAHETRWAEFLRSHPLTEKRIEELMRLQRILDGKQ